MNKEEEEVLLVVMAVAGDEMAVAFTFSHQRLYSTKVPGGGGKV